MLLALAAVAQAEALEAEDLRAMQVRIAANLAPGAEARAAAYKYLRDKNVGEATEATEAVGAGPLASWSREQMRKLGREVKPDSPQFAPQMYRLVARTLRLSDQKMRASLAGEARDGLQAAYACSFWVGQMLRDTYLRARIFEGWLLPALHLAHAQPWKEPSRQGLLERAATAFRAAGEDEALVTLLELIIDTTRSPNTEDWGRIKLAEVYARQKRFDEAIEQIRRVQGREMSGAKAWIPELEKQRDEASASTSTTSPGTSTAQAGTEKENR